MSYTPVLESGSLEEFTAVACGNRDAGRFLFQMVFVLHFFDDCLDGDKDLTRSNIYPALWFSMVEIPANPFYQDYFTLLNSDLQTAITNWKLANEMEDHGAEDRADLRIAFIARSAYVNLILKVAQLCGGVDWVDAIAGDIRRFAHGEGYDAYLKSLVKKGGLSDVLR